MRRAASFLRRASSSSAAAAAPPPATSVSVLFCESCGYTRFAATLAQELRGEGCTVHLDSGGGVGEFEVSATLTDSTRKTLWSKRETGEPSSPEAHQALVEFVRRELRALRRR